MPLILETRDFTVTGQEPPLHSRENGGHICVGPKERFSHRYEMPLDLAASLMHLTMIVGEASTKVMRRQGLDVVRINYQDNGNWAHKKHPAAPHLHIHLYLRTSHERHPTGDPRFQAFPDALVAPPMESGFYDAFQPLTVEDCASIREEIERLLETDRYDRLKESL